MMLLPLTRLASQCPSYETAQHFDLRGLPLSPLGCTATASLVGIVLPPLYSADILASFRAVLFSALHGEGFKVCHRALNFVSPTLPSLCLPWSRLSMHIG